MNVLWYVSQLSMKTYLSQRGYAIDKTPANETLIEQLREELTVKPFVNPNAPGAELVSAFPVYLESPSKFYLPKCYGLKRFGLPTVSKLDQGEPAPTLHFAGSLRQEQLAPVQAFQEAVQDPLKMGGIIAVFAGSGKTVMGLYLASFYKRKTLIVCHKEFLMNQWRERIQQYIPTATVGLIKQSKVDIEGKDLVIASLQSLAMRQYEDSIFKRFGMIIVDEVHHTGAEVFSRALHKINVPISLGLSATPKRADGLTKVIEWHIGKVVFASKKRTDTSLIVEVKRFYDPNPDYGRERKLWNNKLNTPGMITAITQFQPRNEKLLQIWFELKQKEPERRTLVLSDRREHLTTLERMIRALPNYQGTIGYYVGGMTEKSLKESESCDVILATYSMAAEGMDIPVLDTLVLASPVSAIEQPIGRIQRQKPEQRKHIPYVIDFIDEFSLFAGQGKRRITFYQKQGYEVRDGKTISSESPSKSAFRQDDD